MRAWYSLACSAFTALLLGGCGGGESTPPPPIQHVPSWSVWSASSDLVLDATNRTLDGTYVAFGDRDGDLVILHTQTDTNVVPAVVTYRTFRYRRETGWSAPQSVAKGASCPVFSGTAASAYLPEMEAGGLVYEYGAGWKCLPVSPPSSVPAQLLQLSVTADKRILGSRIVGVPTAVAQLEIFELKTGGWSAYKSLPVPVVADVPEPYAGRTPLFWGGITAYEYNGGIVAPTVYTFSPPPSTQRVIVELSNDAVAGAPLSIVLAGPGGPRTVSSNGSLFQYSQSRLVTYYLVRSAGMWNTLLPSQGVPILSLLNPAMITSIDGDLFIPGCSPNQSLCEANLPVQFVDAATGALREVTGVVAVALSEGGNLAVFQTPNETLVSYRLGKRLYTAPVGISNAQLYISAATDAGTERQYIFALRQSDATTRRYVVLQRERA